MKPILFTAAIALFSLPAYAQKLQNLELNTLVQNDASCRMIFTVQSDEPVENLVMETVLFDHSGSIVSLTLFDFQDVPKNNMRVRQFDIPHTQCDTIGRLLFNGVHSCTGDGCGDVNASSRLENVEVVK